MLYFVYSTLVLSFYIDVVLTLPAIINHVVSLCEYSVINQYGYKFMWVFGYQSVNRSINDIQNIYIHVAAQRDQVTEMDTQYTKHTTTTQI